MTDEQAPFLGRYTVVVAVGDAVPDPPEGVTVYRMGVPAPTPESVRAEIDRSGVPPNATRADTVVVFGADVGLKEALAAYAGLVGYAHRRLDALTGSGLVEAWVWDESGRSAAPGEKADPVPAQIQVGRPRPDLPSVSLDLDRPDPEAAALLRDARRVRWVPPAGLAQAISEFLYIAGVRARGEHDRFPFLAEGDEPPPPPGDPTAQVGVCLDTIRFAASGLRRDKLARRPAALAPAAEPTERQRRLERLAGVSPEAVLLALGSVRDPETGFWRCPRPWRHRNGDANPSAQVDDRGVRCMRCDAESLDPLRLVADVLSVTVDEAADWLEDLRV